MDDSVSDFLRSTGRPSSIKIYRKSGESGYLEWKQVCSSHPGFSSYNDPHLNSRLEFCDPSLIYIYGEIPDRIYYSFENSITP